MGLMATPRIPGPDPELVKQREAEKARLEKEQEAADARAADEERKRRANLVGTRSLQDEEIRGFGGFRNMGESQPKSGSIRY